jgi:hypothetical protein
MSTGPTMRWVIRASFKPSSDRHGIAWCMRNCSADSAGRSGLSALRRTARSVRPQLQALSMWDASESSEHAFIVLTSCQICQFCYNKLLTTDSRCPGCRRPYDAKAVVFQPVDWEE